jgi:hypothetical protein
MPSTSCRYWETKKRKPMKVVEATRLLSSPPVKGAWRKSRRSSIGTGLRS